MWAVKPCSGLVGRRVASRRTYLHRSIHFNRIGLIGACLDQGQPHQGVGDAPSLIRQAGLVSRLAEKGFQVEDHGDIAVSRVDGLVDRSVVMKFNEELASKVQQVLNQNQFCLTLGGDHSVGLGTVAGHLESDPEAVLIWVDAHADINTINSSSTGNMHGMPVSLNIKQLQEENADLVGEAGWVNPSLAPSRIAYIGLRDVEAEEWSYIQRFSIPSFPMQTIDRMGISAAVQSALNMVDPLKKRNIHLSFDIDVLDPVEAPATGTRVRGGLTLREALTLCELVEETGRLTGLDLVEVNPSLAANQTEIDTTVDAALEVILAALGKPRS